MKVRNGFVSNSSSSSFILKKSDEYPNAYALAGDMVYCREWDDDDKLANKTKLAVRKRKLSKLNKEEEVKFNCENVSFNSCNYETFIIDFDDYLIVQTCNNHDWSDFYYKNTEMPEEVKEKFIEKLKENGYFEHYKEEYDDNENFYWDELYGLDHYFDFYSLEYDKIGKVSTDWKRCKTCRGWVEYWNIDGIDQCPNCGDTSENNKND